MRSSCPMRRAAACRLSLITVLCAVAGVRAAQTVSGVVVDGSGRAVPRAFVRVIDAAGGEAARGFADESGRFELTADDVNCRVEVTLTGFEPATMPCRAAATGEGLRIELAIAPVRETVLVTATRTDAPASQLGASATVFTAEDLERRQMPLVADLLTTVPGAMVLRSGGPGSVTSLFVRGGESDYNKVLLDGVPLNEAGGSFYLNNLTTENLERVEVVRGAYSALFGSDAMASVIQLFTRRGDRSTRRPRMSAQLDGGTYETLHVNAAVSGAARNLDYSFGAAQFNSDNRSPNSRLENTTLSANVGVAIGPRAMIRFVGRGELEHVGTPGLTAFGRPDLDAFFERHDGVGSVSFDHQLSGSFRQRASYSLATSTQTSTNLNQDPPFRATFEGRTATRLSGDFLNDRRADLRRHHASYQADWRLAANRSIGDHLVTLMADWDGERASQHDRLGGSQTVDARNNFGVSAQHQMLWPRVFVTAGARVEHNENFGTAAVPRASLVYVARGGASNLGATHLKLNAGAGVKEPTMLESFSISPFFHGNPDLKPERSRTFEVGIDQRLANDRAKIELAWFDNRFSDIITLISNPVTFEGRYFNVGVTRARGIELGAQVVPVAAVRARASYTLLDSKIVESTAPDNVLFAAGQWAFRRPRHSGSVGVTLDWMRATVDLSGVIVGRFVDSDFGLFNPPLIENPGHTTWDARFSYRLTPAVTAVLTIDNLTDVDYSEPFGYQPLRRVIRGGMRVGF